MQCPKCGSENIKLDTGGQTGKYRCAKCGYIGVLIIEEDD
ncbi:TFIIB-type zinc ribbon-containing protein [Candidatus Woesearchaeota archaeon]|nr:TFIIB-type zinc ribbon-containing protein [Candidatus Woesearchaeota archaeon]